MKKYYKPEYTNNPNGSSHTLLACVSCKHTERIKSDNGNRSNWLWIEELATKKRQKSFGWQEVIWATERTICSWTSASTMAMSYDADWRRLPECHNTFKDHALTFLLLVLLLLCKQSSDSFCSLLRLFWCVCVVTQHTKQTQWLTVKRRWANHIT